MTTYYPVIGLEIHAELNTKSKMFCACKNDPFQAAANTHICPVCTAQPGALPFANKEAMKSVMKVGIAIGANLADFSEFDRKNYFYPDMPKAYQISQLKHPLVVGGNLAGVGVTRIHLEEDTASSSHKDSYSLVDFNRAGVPLMELVTEPVVNDAETAMAFAKELQLLLRTLGVGEANLEKGEMRIEANISLTTDPERKPENFRELAEVKNLNSFKIVGQAIAYEIERQTAMYEAGGEQIKETRGWDEVKQATFSQRKKETSDDYRYFPCPDIPKFKFSELDEFSKASLSEGVPELPWETRKKYIALGVQEKTVEFFLQNKEFNALFAGAIENVTDEKQISKTANYIASDLAGLHATEDVTGSVVNVTPSAMAELVSMIEAGDLSSRGAKDTLAILYQKGGGAKAHAEENGFIQENDQEAMKAMVVGVITANPDQVTEYKGGNEKLMGFFVGQAMQAAKGSGNPKVFNELFRELL